MCIYGSPAYPLRIHSQASFSNRVLTPQMQAYNSEMSGVVVKGHPWLFYVFELKIGLSSVEKMYMVHALLRNALTCLYSNQTSEFLCKTLAFIAVKLRVPRVKSQKWCFFPDEKWNINSTVCFMSVLQPKSYYIKLL